MQQVQQRHRTRKKGPLQSTAGIKLKKYLTAEKTLKEAPFITCRESFDQLCKVHPNATDHLRR